MALAGADSLMNIAFGRKELSLVLGHAYNDNGR